jgi:hypothetical protein
MLVSDYLKSIDSGRDVLVARPDREMLLDTPDTDALLERPYDNMEQDREHDVKINKMINILNLKPLLEKELKILS